MPHVTPRQADEAREACSVYLRTGAAIPGVVFDIAGENEVKSFAKVRDQFLAAIMQRFDGYAAHASAQA